MTLSEKFAAVAARYADLIADMTEVGETNARRRHAAAPLAKAMLDPRPMDIKALVTETGELIAYVGQVSAPLVKAHPKPAARRPAPSKKKEWKAFLRGHEALAKSTSISLLKTGIRSRIEAGREQVARGELSAVEAARLDVITHRAAALGVWR